MDSQFTEEQLRLTIGDLILNNAELTVEAVAERLFGRDKSNVPSIIISFLSKEFFRQSKNYCRFAAKHWIGTSLKQGSSDFIRKFVAAQENNQLLSILPAYLQSRLIVLEKGGALGSLLIECTRLFNELREKFAPAQSEERFRNFLAQWLQSGFMPLSIYKALQEWKNNDPNLNKFRNFKWPAGTENDKNWRQLQSYIKEIKTDNFVEITNLQTILNILITIPNFEAVGDTIKITGRTLYLSEWKNKIQNLITEHTAKQIIIFAEDCLGIDCDLVDDVWQGKNLTVSSKVVYIWKDSRIRLSGKGFAPGNTKAASANSTIYRGADGDDGRAGESSGNIAILVTKMFNSSRLTVELNGGRGEDGQDGGNGCDGQNGVGVTKQDIDNLVVSYTSLYRDSWNNFQSYSPPSNWTRLTNHSSDGNYIYRTYKDQHGRMMTYSYAADKGWVYSAYELYFIILGSNGTSGTSGGSNGVGGQGGYNGTSTIQNPETGEEFQVNLIRHGKNSGPNGTNGAVGISGKHGINGNDMALIDRSAKERSKHYEGDSNKKLASSYVYKADYKSRLNGYKRFVEKENACFITFSQGEIINTSEQRANKAQERTVRKATSEAVAKQSIIISNVLAETETIFGKQSAFLADACKATAKAAVGEDEAEEEEVQENVTEEVVVLRQKDTAAKLVKYTPESEKKQRIIHTPETYVIHIKSMGPRATINNCAQTLFDLFTIEFPPELFDSIALQTLFQQIQYRRKIQSSLALVLVAALQAKIANGKNYTEIKQFAAVLVNRRKRKFDLSRFRQKLQKITSKVDSIKVNPSIDVTRGADEQFGIKKELLSPKLGPYEDAMKVKEIVKAFFSEYLTNEVSLEMLIAFNNFRKNIKPMYRSLLDSFSLDANLRWADNDVVTVHLNNLKAPFIKKALDKSKKKKRTKKQDVQLSHEEDEISEDEDESIRQEPNLKSDFENFVEIVVGDLAYWKQTIEPVHELIARNSEYTARFGPIPTFKKSGRLDSAKAKISIGASAEEKSIEQAQHLIKIYFLSKEILTYNHRLYICNALMLKEQERFSKTIDHEDDTDFDRFLAQYHENRISLENDHCEVYMLERGLRCEPFRYLLSLTLNIKLCSYREVSFQTLQKIETHNATATQCEILWLVNGAPPTGIAPDMNFRTLVAAQNVVRAQYTKDLIAEKAKYTKRHYEQEDDIMAFASFFAQPLRDAIVEWVENYIAITQDQSFINFLHERLWVDGCHLSVFELQFILASCASLKTLHHCNLDYILLLANSSTQSEMVDVFLYTRIEYYFGRRFSSSSKIFTGIQLIPNTRYKALLAVKLDDYKLPIDEDDLHKLLLMLQHASNGSEQLVNIGLDEWISIAQKQKWSELGYLLKEYGSIGYYLGVLDNKRFQEEEKKMRTIMDEVTIIAEKFVALYTQWIVTGEVEMNSKFFEELKKNFCRANGYPGLIDKEKKYQLITKEIEQAKLINWITTGKISENYVNYGLFASQADRTIDDLSEKIIGLHDSLEEAKKRREDIKRIAKLLKSNDSTKSLNIYWLNKFDDALSTIKKKRLRDTQKMAILCAVESEKNVLEQVNTGEGKSFIIAAIATIRCKTGKRYVDIITSSPVLAQRDAAEMADLYTALKLNVADNCSEDLEIRKKAYTADIVYGDIARFQRDYLLHTFYKKSLKGDRTQVAVIVDEVDNMLLDNGNNMLYLSHSVPGMDLLDSLLIFIQKEIYSPIYTGDKSNIEQMQEQYDSTTIKKKILADVFGQFSLDDLKHIACYNYTEVQIVAIYEKLIQGDIIDADGYLKVHRHDQLKLIEDILKKAYGTLVPPIQACFNVILSRERSIELPPYLRSFARLHLDELIENCKHAISLEANTGYVVDVDRTGKLTSALEPVITIIDSNTGADLATSQWCGGLHQFLQLKHGCCLSPISLKAVFVSNVAYLNGYQYINGLSGTLGSIEESKTLTKLYKNVDLIKIPTNKPKLFYEHVPIIATVQEEWIQNIYDEICDQVTGTRSVLLICEDIKQLEYILNGLTKCFNADINASDKVKECFTSFTVYKREHDQFNFETGHELKSHRLIIATNLAGRGTDIKLSQPLIDAGGLHVITAFMPKNCRIEEQAFGRAARCGQPGSAQIIAYTELAENTVQPSVFQLKMFRDNAEVHRLQSLESFYDYHTEIEELCLNKFRNYCDKALSAMYSNTSTSTDETLPTPSQVVYFALLDQWALWLDGKAPLIEQCSKERSQQLKDTLINSVDEFLKKHPFGDQSNCFNIAKNWINAPQSLLTIGIIQMHHKEGYQEAESTFNKILADGYEFGAEAHYYKACMRMRNFCGTRKEVKSLTLTNPMDFKEDILEAIEHFYKARTLFLNRLERKQKEASIIARIIEKAPVNHPKTSGFASQHKSVSTYIQLILTNIDYLLGTPCEPKMFIQDDIDEAYSMEIYNALYRQGIISPTLIAGRPVEHWQVDLFRQKYKLHKKQIETLIKRMSNDPTSASFEDYSVLDRSLIFKHCPLSTKSEFWAELEQQKVLSNTEIYLIAHDKSAFSEEVRQTFDKLTPYQITNSSNVKTLLQYSNETNTGTMYKLKDLENLIGNSQEFKTKINTMIDNGSLKLDKTAKILIVPEAMLYFSDFDGVTTDDLKEFFNLNEHGVGWIINMLRNNGILEPQTVEMMKLTTNEETWKKLVRVHLEETAKEPTKNDSIEFKLLFNNAGILQQIKDDRKLLNITEQVLTQYLEVPFGVDKAEIIKKLYTYLIGQKLLEPYLYNIWRLNSKLDCSVLPRCIADHVDEFLSDRFAYSFALEKLCLSLEAATKDPEPTPNQIFLAENPFVDLYDDFIHSGLAIPTRFFTTTQFIDDIDYEDFKHVETIKSIIYSNRLKLYDQTDYHMEMSPFSTFVLDQGFTIDSDLRAMMNNGLKVVITRKKEKVSWWLLNKVVAGAAWCWNKIKSAANAVSSFCYSAVQYVVRFSAKVFNAVSNFVSPYINEVGQLIQRIVQPLLNTKFGKAVVFTMQVAKEAVVGTAYAGLGAAEWVINTGKEAVNYVGQKATDVVNMIGDTRVVKGTVGAVKSFGSWIVSTEIWKSAVGTAIYVFTKMSNFCTAISESYQYYNQCRTAARRIAIENQGMVDEHVILKAFHNVSGKENKKVNDENATDDTIRSNIESWRCPILKSVMSTLNKTIEHLPKDKYTIDFVKSALKNNFGWKKLESETNILVNYYAWNLQVWYFKKIETAFKSNIPLKNINFACLQTVSKDYHFFVEDAMNQILEEFQKQANDVGYKSNTENNSTDLINDIFIENIEYNGWKDLLIVVCTNLVKKAIDSNCIKPTISVILSYIASLRDANMPPSEAQLYFNEEDKNRKQALMEYKSNNQSKSKAQFLMTELYSIIDKVININDSNQKKIVLKTAIKYGYPIPLSAAKTVAIAIDNFLTSSGIYKSGILLEITDDEKQIRLKFQTKEGKAKLKMRHINERIFLCQNDYRSYAGISNQTNENINNAFFYEALISFLKHLQQKFPKQAETLRQGVLNEL